MTYILIASLIIMLASLSGMMFIWKIAGTFLQRNIQYFTSFSAGVFLVVALSLAQEALELSHTPTEGLMWVIIGILIFITIFIILPFFHHHHSTDQDEHSHGKHDARMILLSDSIHNLGDGVLLTASFGVSLELGIITTFGIFIHEFIQEISEFFVLKGSGYSTKKALTLNFATSATILIGAIGSFYATQYFHFLELPLIGISAGSFLVVVFKDLIPTSLYNSNQSKKHTEHIFAFFVGVFLILGINSATADTHIHSDGLSHDSHNHGEYVDEHNDHDSHGDHHGDHHDEDHREHDH